MEWLLEHESQARLGAILLAFAALGIVQQLWPRREVPGGGRRLATNIALVVSGAFYAGPHRAESRAIKQDT